MVNIVLALVGCALSAADHTNDENPTCSATGEFCCEAPGGDPNNCPGSARTSNCDKKGSCCCGFANLLEGALGVSDPTKEENPTCSATGEFCCEAPGGDPNNCPGSARTSNCDKKGSCCCGFANQLEGALSASDHTNDENPTCSATGEFCCEAPGGDPNNCPGSARTSNCDKKGSCCCGFANVLEGALGASDHTKEENPTCSATGEFCCEAPGGDPNNCPGSARTSNCDKKGSCCCGFASQLEGALSATDHTNDENPTCSATGEFCCEAPGGDPNNCPGSARTSNCDKKGSCCCGFANLLEGALGVSDHTKEENPTCSATGEFCCEAPGGDPNNCPGSARTSNCDKKGSCCCGFANMFVQDAGILV